MSQHRMYPDVSEGPGGKGLPGKDLSWWRDAVIYQVYPRSWADADGDGVGDLAGVTSRLPHLVELGVDALWLSPFYLSPQRDAGYDVADYRQVDPLFGCLADADAMIARAHELGLRVVVDLVPNHTSSDHRWFKAALASGPGSPERARYLFRDGRGEQGQLPPNDWRSVFGGPAWTREQNGAADVQGGGQWYLHLFDSSQPDLNWDNPEVRAEFEDILRFWTARGVDGFRVDVAHGLVKEEGLPDWGEDQQLLGSGDGQEQRRPPMWDQEGVHDIYRSWRRVLDSSREGPGSEVMLCGEAWVEPLERAARYVRADEMHQAFNFAYLQAPWDAEAQRTVIEASLAACDAVGAPTTWVLSNHDVVRHASRLGMPSARVDGRGPNGVRAGDVQPDAAVGLRRARAASMVMLALPGSAYLYQGEELGLPEHTCLPDDERQDPTWERSGRLEPGRDGCRVPMPWVGAAPACGFSESGRSWLSQPASYAELAVDRQRGVSGSTYELYRSLLRIRRERRLGRGAISFVAGFGAEVLAFRVDGTSPVLVVSNLGSEPVPLPAGELLACSSSLSEASLSEGMLPVDTTVWLGVSAR